MRKLFILSAFFTALNAQAQLTVDFSSDKISACPNETIQFTDLSISSNGIVSWVWDFGDGTSSNLQNPSHNYTYSGYFTVILTVFNGSIAITEVKQNYIFVHNLPQPNFSFTAPACNVPSSISIMNTQPSSNAQYQWDFGNGESSNLQFPTNITYNQEGSYPISLTVMSNITGCSNSTTQTVNIFNYQSSFTLSDTLICQGNQIQFQTTSSPGTNVYNWNFGNGSTSTIGSPNVTFATPGNYTVVMNSQNAANNCSGTSESVITVIPSQSPEFASNIVEGCNPSDITFEVTNGFSGSLNWNFGNGTSFNGLNPPPVSYSIPMLLDEEPNLNQQFNVTLTSTDANGCVVVQNFPNYISIFNIFLDSITCGVLFAGCEPLEVDFFPWGYSGSANYPITGWYWDLGDGTTSTEQFPSNTYMHGIYEVELTVFTSNGCSATSSETVLSGVPPNVYFEVLTDTLCGGSFPSIINFTNVDPEEQLAPIVYFVNYTTSEGNQYQTSDFFPVPVLLTGDISMTLTAVYLGCSNSYTFPGTFFSEPPIAKHDVANVYCNPELPLTVSIFNFPILGEPDDEVSMIYDFGDGTVITFTSEQAWALVNEYINHDYSAYGEYLLTQTVHNFRTGCTHEIATMIRIINYKFDMTPIVDSICFGTPIEFEVYYESEPLYPFISYGININQTPFEFYEFDTAQFQTLDLTYVYTFAESGNNTITLFGENIYGCLDSVVNNIFVVPLPLASVSASPNGGCSPLSVEFNSNAYSPIGLSIESYNWSHNSEPSGSVNSSSEAVFTGEGSYLTMLTVIDAFGCLGSGYSTVELTKPNPDFSIPSIVCYGTSYEATNSTSDFVSAQWYLDGELLSNTTNLSLSFTDSLPEGTFCIDKELKLIVSDANGCVDSTQRYITVSAPQSDFDYQFTGANMNAFGEFTCPVVFANLTNASNYCGNTASFFWSFGDGKNSVLENPQNTYVFAGTYTASLTLTDNYGCQSEVTMLDYLTIGGPSGDFVWFGPDNICLPVIEFVVNSLNDAVEVIWNLGNLDSISSIDGTIYTYNSGGEYYPYVTILDADDCAVTYWLDTIYLDVNSLEASFYVNPTEVVYGNPMEVNNMSSGGFGGIIENYWDFYSNTFVENELSFFHDFNEAGVLDIMLVVFDSLGCSDTAFMQILVKPEVNVPNVFTPNGDGVNDEFRLINNGYKEYEVLILNRWGNVIAQSYVVDDNYIWDGRLENGSLATEGVYYYRIAGVLADGNPREEHGFFHLVRQ